MAGASDIAMIMLVLAGLYILIKSGKLEELFKGGLPALPPLPGLPAPGGGGAPAPSGGGGGGGPMSTGGSCPGGTSCASSNAGTRNECDGINYSSYEATWCGSFSGDDLSVKVWGPNHSGSSCCWCILSVSPDGAFGIRHEGPHPDTGGKSGTTAAIGKPSCIKAVVRPGPGGINLEGHGLVGGQWKKAFSYSGPCGYKSKSTKPASSQQIAFRCDGNLKTTCATVRPLGGGGGAPASPAEPAGGRTVKGNYARSRRRSRYDDIQNSILSRI